MGEIPIVRLAHEFFLEFHRNLIKFPKGDKHTLGSRVSDQTLTLLELLLNASKLPACGRKIEVLREASGKLELLKMLVRMCFEVKAITDKQYLLLQTRLQEIGRMLGGWIRSLNS